MNTLIIAFMTISLVALYLTPTMREELDVVVILEESNE